MTVIVTTPEDLERIVRAAVRAELDAHPAPTPAAAACDWLDTAEVALSLGVTPRTIAKWAAAGLLPAKRLGQKILRFRRADVDAFADQRKGA